MRCTHTLPLHYPCLGRVRSLFLDHAGVTYCYSGIRRKTVLNMPLLPNLDLKNDPVRNSARTFIHQSRALAPADALTLFPRSPS